MKHLILKLSVLTVIAGMISAVPAQARQIVIGGKAFTEQYVLAEITKQVFEKEGLEAITKVGFPTAEIRKAQIAGDLDVTWDYTWTGYSFHHDLPGRPSTQEILNRLRLVDEPNGLIWLDDSGVNDTYGMAVNLDFAAENCVHSITDLARLLRSNAQIRLASDQECHNREDCLLEAQRLYNFEWDRDLIEAMNVSETYEALRERRAEVGIIYTTDGKIPAYDLEILADPQQVFAPYILTPVVRKETLAEYPQITSIMKRITNAMDEATQQDLHYRIDVVGQPIDEVAKYFITLKGL